MSALGHILLLYARCLLKYWERLMNTHNLRFTYLQINSSVRRQYGAVESLDARTNVRDTQCTWRRIFDPHKSDCGFWGTCTALCVAQQ
jgi:hypothetical protein